MYEWSSRLRRAVAISLAVGALVSVAPATGLMASLIQAAAAENGGPGGGP